MIDWQRRTFILEFDVKTLFSKSLYGPFWLIIAAAALSAAIACGGDPEVITEIQTVVVEKQLPGETIKVVETVVVEKQVTRIEKVVETVVVEKTKIEVVVATAVPAQPFMLRAPQTDPKRGGIVRTAWPASTNSNDIHQGGASPHPVPDPKPADSQGPP